MIQNVLSVLAEELNSHFRMEFQLAEDMVVVSSLRDVGSTAEDAALENKIVLLLYQVEEEKSLRSQQGIAATGGTPPLWINLYVLFAANFPHPNYLLSLQLLSGVLGYFQGKGPFDPQNTPSLSVNIDRLSLELINIEPRQYAAIWASLGVGHLPALMYKIRMLRFTQQLTREAVPKIVNRRNTAPLGDILRAAGTLSEWGLGHSAPVSEKEAP